MVFDWRDTVAGAWGSVLLVAFSHPFEVIKVQLQMDARMQQRGIIGTAKTIVTERGIPALWTGWSAAWSSAFIENSVAFTANAALDRGLPPTADPEALGGVWSPTSSFRHLVLGALTGVASGTAICPAEVVKVKMADQAARNLGAGYSSTAACLVDVLRTGGPRRLFAGLGPLLARDIPFNAFFFGFISLYTQLAMKLTGASTKRELPGAAHFLVGGLAGCSTWTITFPADTIKTRMQAAAGSAGSSGAGPSSLGVLRSVLAEGGLPLLYRGWSAAVVRAFPANASLLLGVESARKVLGAGEADVDDR